MNVKNGLLLTEHNLSHFNELKADPILFQRTLIQGCAVERCDATCCKLGVWADLSERDKIIAHAEVIRKYLEPHQPTDPSLWFEPDIIDDSDFPSGKAIGTAVGDSGCVFLKANGHCVLQHAATMEGLDKFSLKPFFCVAYPVTISDGVLTMDDPDHADRPECCSYVEQQGADRPVDVYREELEYMLGEKGSEELLRLAHEWRGNESA